MKVSATQSAAAVERTRSRREPEREPAEGAFAALLVPVDVPPVESRSVSLSGSSQGDTSEGAELSAGEPRSEASGQEVASQEVASQDVASQEVAIQEVAIQEVVSQEVVSQEVVSQEVASQEVASQQVVSQQVVSQQVASQQVVSQEVVSQQVVSQQVVSQDAGARDAATSAAVRGQERAAAQQVRAAGMPSPEVMVAPDASPATRLGEAPAQPGDSAPASTSLTDQAPAPTVASSGDQSRVDTQAKPGTPRGLRVGEAEVSESSTRQTAPESASSLSKANAPNDSAPAAPTPAPSPASANSAQVAALATGTMLDDKSRKDDAKSRLLDSIADKIVAAVDSSTRTSAVSEARAPAAPRAASSPFAPPAVLRAEVIADVRMSALAGQAGTAIQIEHPDFGRIQLQLRMRAGSLELRALTNDLGASMAIRASESLLRERVARRGVSLGSVRVSTRDKTKHRRVTRKRGLDMEA